MIGPEAGLLKELAPVPLTYPRSTDPVPVEPGFRELAAPVTPRPARMIGPEAGLLKELAPVPLTYPRSTDPVPVEPGFR